MTHILSLTREDPIIHIKAYGGVRIKGTDAAEVQCEIDAPQLATLVEDNGHVYITVNSSCQLTVPAASAIQIEKGMGSVKIANIHNAIEIEKVLGNLVLDQVGQANVGRVGGNFSVQKASGTVQVEKVGGTLVVHEVAAFSCEKVGGNCYVKSVENGFTLGKAGGKFLGQDIGGEVVVERIGGTFLGKNLTLKGDLRTGGQIHLSRFNFHKSLGLRAGGEIQLMVADDLDDVKFDLKSGAENITISLRGDDLSIGDKYYEYLLGQEKKRTLEAASGGFISILPVSDPDEDIVGDLSRYFEYEDSPLSEMIQERVVHATRRTEAKVRAAEVRLEQIRERIEKHRGFDVHVDFEEGDLPKPADRKPVSPVPPVPPVTRPAGKKGATDEERLMILQMLQDSKISVDEAEALFKAMES
jgi:hypothetical protein